MGGEEGKGDFMEFRAVLGSILERCGIEGFGERTADPVSNRFDYDGERAFIQGWWEAHGGAEVTTKEFAPIALGDEAAGDADPHPREDGTGDGDSAGHVPDEAARQAPRAGGRKPVGTAPGTLHPVLVDS